MLLHGRAREHVHTLEIFMIVARNNERIDAVNRKKLLLDVYETRHNMSDNNDAGQNMILQFSRMNPSESSIATNGDALLLWAIMEKKITSSCLSVINALEQPDSVVDMLRPPADLKLALGLTILTSSANSGHEIVIPPIL